MFDGINAIYKLTKKDSHIINFHLWEILINEKTGQRINDFKIFNLHGLYFTLKPSINDGYVLAIKGSLHKWNNKGKDNAGQFNFTDLKDAIFDLCHMFDIESNEINLHGLEIGVNINVPFPIARLFKAMVSYKTKPFTQINKTSHEKGFICSLHEYELKVYDKGKQSNIGDKNLLRFEVKIKKMRFLKNTFKNLSDLLTKDNAFSGKIFLENVFNAIIWTDPSANKNLMSNREIKQWLYYSNPKTWQEIKGKEKLLYHRKKWKILLSKYGKTPDILPIILSTWNNLFNEQIETFKTSPFHQHISLHEAEENLTFSHFKCNREKVRKIDLENIDRNTSFYSEEINNISKRILNNSQEKRKCKTCKKDISHQRQQSVYCSSKYVGAKQAKKCRNKISNRKRDIKKKIRKAIIKNKYIAITYVHKNASYTDILHPEGFEFNEWFDKILKIEIK